MDSPSVKRSTRQKKLSLKAQESEYLTRLSRSGYVANIESDEDPNFIFSDDNDVEMCEVEKPKLLHDDEHVHGEDIFKFQTRKQRFSLANKVAEAKTPQVDRLKMRKLMAEKIREEESGSEYECSSSDDSESEGEDSSNSGSESEDDEEETVKPRAKIQVTNIKPEVHTRKGKGKNITLIYILIY